MDKKIKILVSEDNPDIRKILVMRLEINGYDVIQAQDGEEAVGKIKKESPDLVVLDLMMPKMSGFEVCRMIKFDEKYKDLPIIVLSALDQQADREKAIEAGADAYFIKPFDLDLLLSKIKSILNT
jgi:DNA-binding response OmpR family regulator